MLNNLQTKNRADLSQFLIHLTKKGIYEKFVPVDGPPVPGFDVAFRTVEAKPSLEEILQSHRIEARSPFGYFKLKINRYRKYNQQVYDNGGVQPDDIKSVCFSEAPLNELSSFYNAVTAKRNKYKKYGLGFWQEEIRNKGCNPIFYVDSRKKHLLNALDSIHELEDSKKEPLMPLIETFGPPVLEQARQKGGYSDFRWEREWRKKGSLDFKNEDVAFGICPEPEVSSFESMVNNSFPFIDPDWGEARLKEHLTKFGANKLLKSL